MSSKFVVATFSDPDALLRGVRSAVRADFKIYDVYAPYPVHGLEEAMNIRRTRLPWVTFMVGCCALVLALTFQFYTTVLDWPLNVGGKPDNSTLAFVPICFELTVLLSGLATVAALFLRARLYPGKRESLFAEGVTNDIFALVLRRSEAPFDIHTARKLLQESGADRIREREAEQ